MSWCDKLASVPGAGFKIDALFASSDSILDAITPITSELYKNDKALFTVTHQASFEVRLSTEEGFNYAVEPTKLAVEFRHRMRARAVSGSAPTMEMLSRPLPYTQLLPEVSRRLIRLATLTPQAKKRSVSRVGIISTTSVAEDEVPPGIERFIKYIGRPWGVRVEHFSITITTELGKGPGYTDRCIHILVRPDDPEQLMTITLDWQRVFSAGITMQSEPLNEAMERAEKAALKYFEDIGEGRRFDEGIIREAETA